MTTAQPAAGSDRGHGTGCYFDRLWRPRPLSGTTLGLLNRSTFVAFDDEMG